MNFIKQSIAKIKDRIKAKFAKTLGIKTIADYRAELEKFLDDIELLADSDTIDELVAELGIAGTVRQYQDLNYVFKNYYHHMIKEIDQSQNANPELKKLAKRTAEEWQATMKGVVSYLYKKKQTMMYGESYEDEPDYFSDVKVYHANAFSNQELPWLRKDNINEVDYFDEGLFGAAAGSISGAALALILTSLSAAFRVNPKVLTGVSAALGAVIGHFIQKHYFIDFTNYVKLKRYVEYEPESYEVIIEMMQKNATKFKDKDPVKYKKILANLKRLQHNAPAAYKTYLDDEIEAEYDDDPDLFDVYDREGNLVKRGTSELSYSGSGYSSTKKQRSSRRNLGRSSNYDVRDLDNSNMQDVESELNNMLGQI